MHYPYYGDTILGRKYNRFNTSLQIHLIITYESIKLVKIYNDLTG